MPPKLYLHPQNSGYFPASLQDFTDACQDVGLFGEGLEPSAQILPNSFLAGIRFMSLVSFVGCSPYLKITPDFSGDADFTFISVKTSPDLKFYSNQASRNPKCPECNSVWTDWQTIVSGRDTNTGTDTARCPDCGEYVDVTSIDWKRTAGFVRFGLIISNIFPKEAIPSDSLLDFLAEQSSCPWKYFYC